MHRQRMLLLCLLLLLGGCGGTEYGYRDGRDQKEGPGLLSGEDGVFSVYKSGGGGRIPAAGTAAGTEGSAVVRSCDADIE